MELDLVVTNTESVLEGKEGEEKEMIGVHVAPIVLTKEEYNSFINNSKRWGVKCVLKE